MQMKKLAIAGGLIVAVVSSRFHNRAGEEAAPPIVATDEAAAEIELVALRAGALAEWQAAMDTMKAFEAARGEPSPREVYRDVMAKQESEVPGLAVAIEGLSGLDLDEEEMRMLEGVLRVGVGRCEDAEALELACECFRAIRERFAEGMRP